MLSKKDIFKNFFIFMTVWLDPKKIVSPIGGFCAEFIKKYNFKIL